MRNNILNFSIVVLLTTVALRADEPAMISIHGFLDGYYAWNSNQPANHQNFVPGTGTSAEKGNELAVNLAAVEFVRDPKPVGFHVSLVAGTGADVVHSGEPHHHPYRNLYQASLTYKAQVGRGVLFEAGVYPSHIGFEGFFSKDNWDYTRGWMGEFSPYYQAGIKAAYAWSDRWSGQVHLLTGWQRINENNAAKSIGTQIAYSGPRFSAVINTFAGPELPHDNKDLRLFIDLIGTYNVTPKLSFATSLDRGRQEFANDSTANWLGASLWSRYAFDDRHAIAVRAERFRDPENGITGMRQTLTGATATYEFRPDKHLILKVEGRRDHSTAPLFVKSRDAMTNHETLVIVGAVATF